MKSWKERIEEAEVRGGFTEEDFTLANDWRLCAVGEKLDLASKPIGMAFNLTAKANMIELSQAFDSAVRDDSVKLAKRVYERIQKKVIAKAEDASPDRAAQDSK